MYQNRILLFYVVFGGPNLSSSPGRWRNPPRTAQHAGTDVAVTWPAVSSGFLNSCYNEPLGIIIETKFLYCRPRVITVAAICPKRFLPASTAISRSESGRRALDLGCCVEYHPHVFHESLATRMPQTRRAWYWNLCL